MVFITMNHEIMQKLGEDIVEYIESFDYYARNSGKSKQDYDYALRIRDHDLPALCGFAKRYLGIEIKIRRTPVKSQYDPGHILGYEITVKNDTDN